MPQLSAVRLFVSDPAQLADFYTTHLGMIAQETPQGWRVGYAGEDADILLCPDGPDYTHSRNDRYWKVGLTLPNVDIAYDQLVQAGIDVSPPRQFLDIGYMCHLSDPSGFQIELLQHDFENNRPAGAGNPSLPLGGGTRIGQITLRTGHAKTACASYDTLGMRLLSVQPVPDYEFDLYFLAFTEDTPPSPRLRAIENREWLWKRPYTTLEFQHVPGLTPAKNPNYGGLEIIGLASSLTDDVGDLIHPG